jgi:hypothetical protein
MTEGRMALVESAEEYADGEWVRERGQLMLQRLMVSEAGQETQSSQSNRTATGLNSHFSCGPPNEQVKCDTAKVQQAGGDDQADAIGQRVGGFG